MFYGTHIYLLESVIERKRCHRLLVSSARYGSLKTSRYAVTDTYICDIRV